MRAMLQPGNEYTVHNHIKTITINHKNNPNRMQKRTKFSKHLFMRLNNFAIKNFSALLLRNSLKRYSGLKNFLPGFLSKKFDRSEKELHQT